MSKIFPVRRSAHPVRGQGFPHLSEHLYAASFQSKGADTGRDERRSSMEQFPPGTHLSGLKDAAKSLLKSAKSRDPDALQRFAPFFTDLTSLKRSIDQVAGAKPRK